MDQTNWQTAFYILASAVMLVMIVWTVILSWIVLKIHRTIKTGIDSLNYFRSYFLNPSFVKDKIKLSLLELILGKNRDGGE